MTGGFIEQMFDEVDYEVLNMIEAGDYYSSDNDWDDCYLTGNDLKEFLTPADVSLWVDVDPTLVPAIFSIDDAKKNNWGLAKSEIKDLKKRVGELLNKDLEIINTEDIHHLILMKTLGPGSEIGQFLRKELELSTEKYLKFMFTFFMQAAYRISVTALYDKQSLLKSFVPIEKEEYLEIWKLMSTKKKVPPHMMRSTRCSTPLWQTLEAIVNAELKNIVIAGREGRIAISLDDDKVWFANNTSNMTDLFDVKYTTHTQANRKGMVAHTAVTTGHMVPLNIAIERKDDSATKCLTRMLTYLFGSSGSVDLQNIDVHSDRGYMVRATVDFFLEHGANFVGTIKRLAKCWPFTFNQQVNPKSDGRTVVDVKGAPTLFLKCNRRAGRKTLFTSAFCNGSQSVATALSSLHCGFQWEGSFEAS